jgi:hypothetical protein
MLDRLIPVGAEHAGGLAELPVEVDGGEGEVLLEPQLVFDVSLEGPKEDIPAASGSSSLQPSTTNSSRRVARHARAAEDLTHTPSVRTDCPGRTVRVTAWSDAPSRRLPNPDDRPVTAPSAVQVGSR